MKKIKTFFTDFGNLSRWEFYVKYFLPFILLIFSWALIGALIELSYKKEYLNKINGNVIAINEVSTQHSKSSSNELRIHLNNYPKYFRITDNYKYENILERIKPGDEVVIYFRPIYVVPIGAGKQTDVYQLE